MNQLMIDYINKRVEELSIPIFLQNLERLKRYESEIRARYDLSEEHPAPKQDSGAFHLGVLSDMPTLEMPAIPIRRRTESLH